MIRDQRALAAFHLERTRDHGHREDAEFLRHLCDHRCRARARSTTHAGGDEQHVAALDHLDDPIAVFHRRLPAHFRIGARAETLGDIAADLQRGFHLRVLESLRIGVDAQELHALDATANHVGNCVAAAATYSYDFDYSVLAVSIH